MKLTFSRGNAKLDALEKAPIARGGHVYTFSLLSGYTCPYANKCLSRAVFGTDGRYHIEDGPNTLYRCFSASQEALYPAVFKARERNGEIVKLAAQSIDAAAGALWVNIPKKATIVRVHVGGDFQTKNYMAAWLEVARQMPDRLFYAYTKSLPFWVALRNSVPDNFILTASYGGWKDALIEREKLRYSKVVFSVQEAENLGLEIDHDDTHAANPELREQSFALLIHGVQPKGSDAAAAVKELNGVGSYGRGN